MFSSPFSLTPHVSYVLPPSGSLCRLLLELLELLFDKFKAVAHAHSVVLAHLQQIGVHEEDIKLYEQADVSAKIQTVLQVSLSVSMTNIFSIKSLKTKIKTLKIN